MAEEGHIPAEALAYLKENLVEADAAARRGDLKSVYMAYMNLAQVRCRAAAQGQRRARLGALCPKGGRP